jgi:DNA-binding CsgD family transcriptional regulator
MERQVVRLVSLGCTVKEVAAVLQRSLHTIDNHKSRAMRKLGVRNLATLTRRAVELGISGIGDELSADERHALSAARRQVASNRPAGSAPPTIAPGSAAKAACRR